MIDFFSPDYFAARNRFRAAVLRNGGQIESILLNARGPAGEDLTVDIGWFGCQLPGRVLLHSSGLHGVEGFAGSAIQLQWLEQGPPKLPPDGAIAMVHVMNPYGMVWLRRANESNVDLGFNFLGAENAYQGASDDYRALDPFLNPPTAPRPDFFRPRAFLKSLRFGMPVFERLLNEGQYEFPHGLCYGGDRHEQVTRRFQLYISSKLAFAEKIAGIDVHTGAGRFAEQTFPASSPGSLEPLYRRMFPGAAVEFRLQEFGCCSLLRALERLRDENRGYRSDPLEARNPAKTRLFEAFCPADETWRKQVLTLGGQTITDAAAMLFDWR